MGSSSSKNYPDVESVTLINPFLLMENSEIKDQLDEARSFILFYDWLESITHEYLGYHAEGILSIFLFKITPNRLDIDKWVWVIVGDLPSAYITCENAKNPWEALDSYIGAMEEWIKAARNGKSVSDLIPVNVPATVENAEMLARRINFLDTRILPLIKELNNSLH